MILPHHFHPTNGVRPSDSYQRFVYNGYLQIADSTGNAYIWDPTERVATRPLVWQHGDSVLYYTHDGKKDVSEVVSDENEISAHYGYAPFGAVTSCIGDCASFNPWRFSSEYADDSLGLVYYNYRHFYPQLGRWLCRDSIQEFGSINLFLFADNNSVNSFDFRGECHALLLIPGVWVVVDVVLKITVAAVASVIIVEATDNIYQTYKEECGKCEESTIEVRRETRLRKRDNSKYDDCIKACLITLPTRHHYGFPFFRCVRKCMEGR